MPLNFPRNLSRTCPNTSEHSAGRGSFQQASRHTVRDRWIVPYQHLVVNGRTEQNRTEQNSCHQRFSRNCPRMFPGPSLSLQPHSGVPNVSETCASCCCSVAVLVAIAPPRRRLAAVSMKSKQLGEICFQVSDFWKTRVGSKPGLAQRGHIPGSSPRTFLGWDSKPIGDFWGSESAAADRRN